MLTWVFIFLGAVGLTAVLILIGLAIATLEEICKRDFMSRPELRNREAEKWFRRKPYGKE